MNTDNPAITPQTNSPDKKAETTRGNLEFLMIILRV